MGGELGMDDTLGRTSIWSFLFAYICWVVPVPSNNFEMNESGFLNFYNMNVSNLRKLRRCEIRPNLTYTEYGLGKARLKRSASLVLLESEHSPARIDLCARIW